MVNVALIGLGNIALLFDTNKATNATALSHVKAIFLHEDFNLKYAVDINLNNEKILKDFFPNCELQTSHNEIIDKNDIDILVIATPTNNHFSILNDFKNNKNIKIFFVEKPLFSITKEYNNLSKNIKNKIIVNYLRRFAPAFIDLKQRLSNEDFIEKIVINYCKGLKNNGSHLIDLLNYLLDDLKIKSSSILSSSTGFDESDLCYDLYILISYKNQTIPIFFISHNHKKYNLISMDIYTNSQQIKFLNSKGTISYYKIVNDLNFPTYKVFNNVGEEIEINNEYLMYYAYEKISKILNDNERNISSFEDELKNKNFLEYILKDL